MANTRLPVQNQASFLAGSGCVVGATSITLQSFTQIDGTALVMTDFGTKGFMTLEPNNSTQEELISFTGITQNANGTAILTGVSSVLPISPFTETSGVLTAHPGGAVAIVTNTAQWYAQLAFKGNDESVTGAWTFPVPLADFNPATKKYVDDLVNGGTVTNAAVVVSATAGETIVAGNLVYFSETDNEWLKCDADTAATVQSVMLGIAQGSGTNGNPITGGVLIFGADATGSGMTQGDLLYASNTAGGINSGTPGTTPRVIGIATSATARYFNPFFESELTRYAVDAVGTDAYAVTLPGAFSAYYPGMAVNFKPATANTGACTLAVNGGTAKAIKRFIPAGKADPVTGEILANQVVSVIYDGTDFVIVSRTPYVIDLTTDVTGVLPVANLTLPAFNQNFATSTSEAIAAPDWAAGSSNDGSVLYVIWQTGGDLFRFARDAVTGQYFQTHRITPTLSIPATDTGGIIQIGTFIYLFSNDGTNIVVSRFLAADLTGEQVMTVPTVPCTDELGVWTDGTDAYVVSNASQTTSRRWTVSGTTFNAASTATVTTSIFERPEACSMYDGTNAFYASRSGQTVTIQKLTAIDGSARSASTVTLGLMSDAQAGTFIVNIGTSRMYLGFMFAQYDEAAQVSSRICLFPITKP